MKTPKNAHLWERHPDDWYVEPEWCSDRLFAEEQFTGPVWDPACGLGRVVEQARAAWLQTTPLRRVWFMTPRPSMPPGPVIEAGIAPGNGTADFCWVVWLKGYDGTPEFRWMRRDAA